MCFLCGATQISEIGRWEWLFLLFFVVLLLPLWLVILIDFSLYTVKALTLIFIFGRGLAISSAKQGNPVLFIIW